MQMKLPEINSRIKHLIDVYADGNVAAFVRNTGISSHQVLNRIFSIDNRTGKYPKPSSEVISKIQIALPKLNPKWLLTGEGEMLQSEYSEPNLNITTMELKTLLKAIEQHGEELRKQGERLDRMLDIIAPIEQSHVG